MTRLINQVILGASRRDAITNMALNLRDALAKKFDGGVYSFHHPDESASAEVKQLNKFPVGSSDDVLIYHSSYGIPQLTSWLLNRPEKLVLVYHNITPAEYYLRTFPDFSAGLSWGRQELSYLRSNVNLSAADSQFNANELESFGYQNVIVEPAGVNPFRLRDTTLDVQFLRDLRSHFPNGHLTYVSQVLNHKRVELALEVIQLIRSIYRHDIGLVIAGPRRHENYNAALAEYKDRLPQCHALFLGETTDSQLETLYRSSLAYIGTSDHEGLSVPPLEAMAAGIPVIVRDAGAIQETVGDGGIVLPNDASSAEMAGVVNKVLCNEDLRISLISNGLRRAQEFSQQQTESRFITALEELTL